MTDEAYRGQGHGLRLVRAARRTMAELGRDLGIFTCDTELAGFYRRAGWQLLPGTVLIGGTPEQPFPSDQFDKVTLGSLFTDARPRARRGLRARADRAVSGLSATDSGSDAQRGRTASRECSMMATNMPSLLPSCSAGAKYISRLIAPCRLA